ncbi:universal stress protein [Pseudomonas taiwanensis SJ9]|uniref:Universal stress protein n=1 Tax=Pseudomonas taiwanensis SJ9 TaxID=1388762 RepID=V7DCS9_9PSED|nr:universal stress protein [Pseudomonas taiwanensis SJ9]
MPSPVLIAIDASPASTALLTLARRYCRPDDHELHVLLAIDSTFAVHDQPAPYTAEELEEYPAACEEQHQADQAVAEAVRELQQAASPAGAAWWPGSRSRRSWPRRRNWIVN